MATPDDGPAPPDPGPGRKKGISPARNSIGLLLLLSFSTVAYREWDANSGRARRSPD